MKMQSKATPARHQHDQIPTYQIRALLLILSIATFRDPVHKKKQLKTQPFPIHSNICSTPFQSPNRHSVSSLVQRLLIRNTQGPSAHQTAHEKEHGCHRSDSHIFCMPTFCDCHTCRPDVLEQLRTYIFPRGKSMVFIYPTTKSLVCHHSVLAKGASPISFYNANEKVGGLQVVSRY